jgi:hypothetical protein
MRGYLQGPFKQRLHRMTVREDLIMLAGRSAAATVFISLALIAYAWLVR